MTTYVVDANVAAKWYIDEEGTEQAIELLVRQQSGEAGLHVPELFFAEIGSIVWKKQRLGQILRPQAERIVRAVAEAPLSVHSLRALAPSALHLACELDHSVYDAVYLALALSLRTEMVTADRRWWNRLAQSPYRAHVRWVGGL